jgi:hypothetical protein
VGQVTLRHEDDEVYKNNGVEVFQDDSLMKSNASEVSNDE